MKRFLNRGMLFFILVSMSCAILVTGLADKLFASEIKPIEELYIGKDTPPNQSPMFSVVKDGFWLPGKNMSGIMRIHNKHSEGIEVTNIGLKLNLSKLNGEVYQAVPETAPIFEKYARNMHLLIKKDNLPVFSSIIYDKTFYEVLCNNDRKICKGYDLQENSLKIVKGGFVELEYTVTMDIDADNDLQGTKAEVYFQVNVQGCGDENNGADDNGNGTNNNGGNNDKEIVTPLPESHVGPEMPVAEPTIVAPQPEESQQKLEAPASLTLGGEDELPRTGGGYFLLTALGAAFLEAGLVLRLKFKKQKSINASTMPDNTGKVEIKG